MDFVAKTEVPCYDQVLGRLQLWWVASNFILGLYTIQIVFPGIKDSSGQSSKLVPGV